MTFSSIEASRRWRLKNPEKQRDSNRRWRAGNIEKRQELDRHWRMANREKKREAYRRWAAANPEKRRKANREAGRRWRTVNSDKKRETGQRRRAQKQGLGGIVSRGIVKLLLVKQDWSCAYDLMGCRTPDLRLEGYHLDHIMPLVLGGRHEDPNLQLTCPTCNLRKHARHPSEFLRSFICPTTL